MKSHYPVGAYHAHFFQIFNAISFQVLMGAPVIIYAKSLGASPLVLGVIASFTPLMTVFQLPAAQHLHRYGYRQFVLMGWSLRTVFIFVIAAVPLLTVLSDTAKMTVLVGALFCYNLLRGISTAAWLPWISAWIPEDQRGRFLSTDNFFLYAGCLISLVASGLLMSGHAASWEYSLVFLLSALGATVSLFFIRKIPDIPALGAEHPTSQKVPWRAMLAYEPFRRLIDFNILYSMVLGSLGVFPIAYLRDLPHFDVSNVLFLSAFTFIGALLMLPFSRRMIDRGGSKPLMRVAVAIFGLVIGIWGFCAAGVFPTSMWLIALLYFLPGIASANFSLANSRITLSTMPEMGRNHFFALFTVINSLSLGVAPILWGKILDAIGTHEVVTGGFHWTRYSIYFMALLVLNLIAFVYISRLHEAADAGEFEPSMIYSRLKQKPKSDEPPC